MTAPVTAGLARELAAAVGWGGDRNRSSGGAGGRSHARHCPPRRECGRRSTAPMASGGRAPRTRLLGRPTRRYHRKTRRRQHDDARRAGAGNPRSGGRGVGTTLSRAGGVVIRVLIVSPRSGARSALEHVVARDPGLLLVAASDSFDSLDGVIDECRPDVIVLGSGPESQLPLPVLLEQRLNREATPFVVLLEDLDGEAGARALRAGARAVLPRSASPEEIRAAVRAAAAGLASLPATLAGALLDGTSRDGARAGTGDHILTPREREILTLLGEGLVNKEIGARLGISEHTVKSHLTAIYEKLEASNRAEAVATGLRRGLVML